MKLYSKVLSAFALIILLSTSAEAGIVGFNAFANDTVDSFEGIASSLPGPNYGADGIRGEMPTGYTTGTGLQFLNRGNYINDFALGYAALTDVGLNIGRGNDLPDGTAYLFTYNHYGENVVLKLPHLSTRFGAYMGGSGVQNTTFYMYFRGTLVDTFNTSAYNINFAHFTGWQSDFKFDTIEWYGGHSAYDNFAFDYTHAPEPSTYILLGSGLLGLIYMRRRSRA